MSLFAKKQQINRSSRAKPLPSQPLKKPGTKREEKTLFSKKGGWNTYLRRSDLKNWFRWKAPSHIPGSSGSVIYSREERAKMVDRFFPRAKYRDYISKKEAIKALRQLKKEASRAKSTAERTKINRVRRYLHKVTGLGGSYY